MAVKLIPNSSNSIHGQNTQLPQRSLSEKIYETFEILFGDILPANFNGVIPNAVFWAYRTFWTGSIHSCDTFDTAGKVADLFTHNTIVPKADNQVPAILMLHGEHSHALTMLHLGDIAEIAANWDWCIDPQASIANIYCPFRHVNASHLGVLYHPDTLTHFKTWVATNQ